MPEGSKPLLQSNGSQTRFNMSQKMEGQKRKKVLIVGAGAAGMSAAHHLATKPEYDITLVDPNPHCGGQAFSIPIDKQKTGASWLNQGVQGGSYIFHHTMCMFGRNGYWADPVKLQVSFGKGDGFWSNVFPTQLLKKHEKEVVRYFRMLKIVRMFEVFFALLPIKILVKLFRFSEEFANVVALPLVALFLGTGNYAPEVPSMVLERLSTSETYGLWYPPDKASVASNIPNMVVFPNLTDFYETWRQNLVKAGVTVRLSTEVTTVVRRDKNGVVVKTKVVSKRTEDDPTKASYDNNKEATEEYDEIILCTLTDKAKSLLKPCITGMESRILGSAKFANDITVTHQDHEYMKRHYENFYSSELAVSEINGVNQQSRLDYAKDNFKAMYLIRMYPQDLRKLEMCFDCTNYQAQFPPTVPFENHVFQTIFLNNERDSHIWTIDEIDESKIIQKNWWHQLCHSWTHYAFVVPWMWLLQGKQHTRFAGSWTLVNAHEVAVISGIAAAVDLGAEYPHDLERDIFAFLAFRVYYLLVYGKWYRRVATKTKAGKEGEGKDWATGNKYGNNYAGPGVNAKEERLIWKKDWEAGKSLDSW